MNSILVQCAAYIKVDLSLKTTRVLKSDAQLLSMPRKLYIFASHLSHSNILTLKVLLKSTKADKMAVWEYTNNSNEAAAILIDTDSKEGALQLKELGRKKNHQVLIAFSNRAPDFPEGILVLPRPLRSAELCPLLQQASRNFLNSQQIILQDQQDTDLSPSLQQYPTNQKAIEITNVSTRPRRVLEILYSNRNKILKITDRSMRAVFFDTEKHHYYTSDLVRIEIEALLASSIENVQLEEIDRKQFKIETQSLKMQDLDPLLWTAALGISTDGQLFHGLSFIESYRLNRWPDLRKLGSNALHLKFAALLRQECTISYMADDAKAELDEVVSFINACYSLSYLEHQEQPLVPLQTRAQKTPASADKISLLSRIHRRLGI